MSNCKKDDHCKLTPQPMLLLCGKSTANGRVINGDLRDEKVQLARVTIDTEHLCHPTIKIEFSNNIKFEEVDVADMLAQARVRYDLFKLCKGQNSPVLLDSWIYERDIRLNDANDFFVNTTDTFSFHYCENCDVECFKCCEYFVVASIEAINNARVTYLQSAISAFVQESPFTVRVKDDDHDDKGRNWKWM